MNLLSPERYFTRVSRISVSKDIVDEGFKHVLLDMDNTVLPRDGSGIPRDVVYWLSCLRRAGIAVCLLSNNWHESPYRAAQELGLPVVAKACKPLPHAFLIARDRIGARSATTLVVGDQLSTDILGAHVLGMKAYLVCPLVEADLKHTQVLRGIEGAMLGSWQPEGGVVACSAKEGRDADNASVPSFSASR